MDGAEPLGLAHRTVVVLLRINLRPPPRRRDRDQRLPAGGLGTYGVQHALDLDQVAERRSAQQGAVRLEPADPLHELEQQGLRPIGLDSLGPEHRTERPGVLLDLRPQLGQLRAVRAVLLVALRPAEQLDARLGGGVVVAQIDGQRLLVHTSSIPTRLVGPTGTASEPWNIPRDPPGNSPDVPP